MFQMSVNLEGSKLVMPGRKTDELKNFLETLPNIRWWKSHEAHACDATPASAWRIVSRAPCYVLPSEEVMQLAHRFLRRYESFKDNGDQPERRRLDSWEHQRRAYWFAYHRDSALFDMHMGTGKSKPTCELVINKDARRVLVLCPVAVLGVWRREFNKWGFPEEIEVMVIDKKHWTVARKAKEAAKFMEMAECRGKRAIVVINYDSACMSEFQKWSLGVDWDVVICDESHRIANANTNVCKYTSKLGMVAKFRLCLTGTPMSKDPLSIFGQMLFLDRGLFGTSWARFRNRYAVTGEFGADHVVDYKNLDELGDLMSLLTFSVGEEVLDLPDIVMTDQKIRFEPSAMQTYKRFEEEFITTVGADEKVLTASNVLVKLLRLQQMTSGMVPVDSDGGYDPEWNWDTEYQPEPPTWEFVSDAKKQALKMFLMDLDPDEPAIVFCKFKQDLVAIREIAEELGKTYGEISGSQKDLTPDSTMPEDIQLMGVQMQSGGMGIDLTRARYVFYYSVGYSLADFKQSMARAHRPGQDRTVFVYHLVVEDTIDEAIYQALERRENVNSVVAEYLKIKQEEMFI